MKNLKKVFALVLSLAMIVSTFTVSFAAEDAKTDAEVCEALGLIQGDGDGVTEEYLGTESPRWKIAIMSLRLSGKYEEALAFEGTETFADAEDMTWVAGRAILAYLKANPDCGWQGDDKNSFDPNGMMTVQQYYKVMLETLGYKQGTDFEWAEVMDFAASKGLVVAADAEKLTMNDVAAVTVETLKAETSEGKTLTETLVEDGVIDADSATDLLDYVAPVTAKMVEARAIDSTTLTATFDEAVDVDADDFSVVAGDKEFEVSSVTSANGGKVAVLTVAELTVGSKYTLTNGEVSKTVVPTTKKDETKPAIESALAITGEIVQVVINTTNVNQDTLVADNFSLNNDASVLSAEINLDEMKKNPGKTVVVLGVSGLKAGKAFTLTSNKVESFKGLVADESKATFAGTDKDTKGPKVKSAKSIGGYQVEVYFEESVTLDEATATEIGNYSISPELEIKDARIKKNVIGTKNGDENVVVLTTSDQKASTAYTLTVNNVSDGTNVMKEAGKTVFAGLKKATNQVAKAAKATDATKVQVEFEFECNDTALDVANYEIDKDIQVTGAEFKEQLDATDNINKKIVVLTTSEMKSGTAYALTVKTGVQDILGQGLKESKKLVYAGVDKDTEFLTSGIKAKAKNKTTVEITFAEEVDRVTALEVANYKISDLGYPSNVSLDTAGLVATLTVQEQKASQSYTITLNNIKDKAGNVVKADTKVKFTGIGDTMEGVAVKEVTALSENLIKVVLNQKISNGSATSNVVFTLTKEDGSKVTGLSNLNEVTTAVSAAATDTLVIELGTGGNGTSDSKLSASYVYKLKLKGLDNATGSVTGQGIADKGLEKTFVGSSAKKATFSLTGAVAIDQTHIKLLFDNNVENITGTLVVKSNNDLNEDAKDRSNNTIGSINLSSKATVNSNNKKEVVVELANKLKDNEIYYIGIIGGSNGSINTVESNPSQIKLATDTDKSYAKTVVSTGVLEDATTAGLQITSAVMFNKNVIEVEFNRDLDTTNLRTTYDSTSTDSKVNGNDFRFKHGDTVVADAKVVKVVRKPKTNNTLILYVTGADKLPDASGMVTLELAYTDGSTSEGDKLTTALGGVSSFKTDGNKYNVAVAKDTKKELPAIISATAVNNNKIKVIFNDNVFANAAPKDQDHSNAITGLAKADFVLVNATDNTPIDSSKLQLDNADSSKAVYLTLTDGVFIESKTYKIAIATGKNVYSVDGINKVKTSANVTVANDITEYVEFGGIASSSSFVATVSSAILNNSNLIITGTGFSTNYTVDITKIKVKGVNLELNGSLPSVIKSATRIEIPVSNINNIADVKTALASEGVKTDALEVQEAWLADVAGNKASAEAASGNSVTYDETKPVVTAISVDDTHDSNNGAIFTIKFSESVTYTDKGDLVAYASSLTGTESADDTARADLFNALFSGFTVADGSKVKFETTSVANELKITLDAAALGSSEVAKSALGINADKFTDLAELANDLAATIAQDTNKINIAVTATSGNIAITLD